MTVRAGRSRKGLYVIGAGAAVSLWGGWVGLGGLAGFGSVTLFPGIPWLSRIVVDLAITLPFTMEAYAAVAVGFALDRTLNKAARKYALLTAIGSVLMAMGAQAGFHLLTALHRHAAPWEVVMLVSWVPLAVFIMATGLYHLAERPAAPEAPAAEAASALSRVAALDALAGTITPHIPEPERWPDGPARAGEDERADGIWLPGVDDPPAPVPDEPAAVGADELDREVAELFGDQPASPRPEPARPPARTPAPAGKWTPESAGVPLDELRRLIAALSRNKLADHLGVGRSTASHIIRDYGPVAAPNGAGG